MRILVVVLLTFISLNALAQTNFGLKLGIDNTKFSGQKPDGLTYQFRRGPSIGAFIDFQLADQVQLSIRPGYAIGGANIAIEDTVNNSEAPLIYPVSDSYFSLATLFKIYEREKIYAFVGPELNYLLTSEVNINGNEVDLSKQFNEVAISINIGFGLNFDMFKAPWAVEWQFNQMLTTLTEDADIENGISPKLRTSRARIGLLYKFKRN